MVIPEIEHRTDPCDYRDLLNRLIANLEGILKQNETASSDRLVRIQRELTQVKLDLQTSNK